MRNLAAFLLLMLFAQKTFSQVNSATSQTSMKTGHLKKSKTQKTVAWVLVAAGSRLGIWIN